MTYKGGSAWREHLKRDLRGVTGLKALLDERDDDALHRLMTNLAGNDLDSCLESFHAVNDEVPTCWNFDFHHTIPDFWLLKLSP